MFGTLRPGLCHLSKEQGQAYRRMYCGTCKALGDHYGQLARPLLSFDIVLFASVIEALQAEPSQTGSCRCPLLPVVHRPTLTPDSTSMHVAAAVQVVLADQWLADQQQDGARAVGLLRPVLGMSERARKATDDLVALGFDVSAFTDLATRQHDIERQGRNFARAAEPTAAVLQSLFAQLPGLTGMAPDAVTDTAEIIDAGPTPRRLSLDQSLAALGHNVGTAIYALDALEDLQDDLTAGQFNPCLDDHGRISRKHLAQVGDALETALDAMVRAVSIIPWRRHGVIVENVLCRQFHDRCVRALATARAQAEQWLETPPVRRIWPVRALLALLGVVTGLWSFAARRVQLVRRRRQRLRRRRAGTGATAAIQDGPVCHPAPALVTAGARGDALLSTGSGMGGDGGDDNSGHVNNGGHAPGFGPDSQPADSAAPSGQPDFQSPERLPATSQANQSPQAPMQPSAGVPLELAPPVQQNPRQQPREEQQRKRKSSTSGSWFDDILCCDLCCCDAACCAVEAEGSCCTTGCCSLSCCEGVCGDGSCCDCCDCADCVP